MTNANCALSYRSQKEKTHKRGSDRRANRSDDNAMKMAPLYQTEHPRRYIAGDEHWVLMSRQYLQLLVEHVLQAMNEPDANNVDSASAVLTDSRSDARPSLPAFPKSLTPPLLAVDQNYDDKHQMPYMNGLLPVGGFVSTGNGEANVLVKKEEDTYVSDSCGNNNDMISECRTNIKTRPSQQSRLKCKKRRYLLVDTHQTLASYHQSDYINWQDSLASTSTSRKPFIKTWSPITLKSMLSSHHPYIKKLSSTTQCLNIAPMNATFPNSPLIGSRDLSKQRKRQLTDKLAHLVCKQEHEKSASDVSHPFTGDDKLSVELLLAISSNSSNKSDFTNDNHVSSSLSAAVSFSPQAATSCHIEVSSDITLCNDEEAVADCHQTYFNDNSINAHLNGPSSVNGYLNDPVSAAYFLPSEQYYSGPNLISSSFDTAIRSPPVTPNCDVMNVAGDRWVIISKTLVQHVVDSLIDNIFHNSSATQQLAVGCQMNACSNSNETNIRFSERKSAEDDFIMSPRPVASLKWKCNILQRVREESKVAVR